MYLGDLVVKVCLVELVGKCLDELVVKLCLVEQVQMCQVSWWYKCAWLSQ